MSRLVNNSGGACHPTSSFNYRLPFAPNIDAMVDKIMINLYGKKGLAYATYPEKPDFDDSVDFPGPPRMPRNNSVVVIPEQDISLAMLEHLKSGDDNVDPVLMGETIANILSRCSERTKVLYRAINGFDQKKNKEAFSLFLSSMGFTRPHDGYTDGEVYNAMTAIGLCFKIQDFVNNQWKKYLGRPRVTVYNDGMVITWTAYEYAITETIADLALANVEIMAALDAASAKQEQWLIDVFDSEVARSKQ